MTRQEAIETIKIAISQVEWEYPMDYAIAFDMAIEALNQQEIIRCNRCKHYEGVHNVQGHAPCLFWRIGSVMWNEFCSRFEEAEDVHGMKIMGNEKEEDGELNDSKRTEGKTQRV